MPSALQLESPIRLAFVYGRISCDLYLAASSRYQNYRPNVSDAELRDIFSRAQRFAQRRIQDRVAPTLEQLVEDSGAQIGEAVPAEAAMERQVFNASLGAHTNCEVMADVDPLEVSKTVVDELLIPLDDYTDGLVEKMALDRRLSRPDYSTPFGSLLNRVRDTLRGR